MFKQTEETVVRDIFGQLRGVEHAIGEAENSVTVALVQFQKSRFTPATCFGQQSFVCHAFGQLGLPPRSVGGNSLPGFLLPAIFEKIRRSFKKNLRDEESFPISRPRYTRARASVD